MSSKRVGNQPKKPAKSDNPPSPQKPPPQKSVVTSKKDKISATPSKLFSNEQISNNIPKSLSSRIANIFFPTWLSNGYTASSIHLGLGSANFQRTTCLALSLILECTKNYLIYLYFYIEYKKSLEDIINNKPVDPTVLYNTLFKFSLSIIFYVGTQALSSALLRKFIDSLATAIKIHLTTTWIELGTYNGNNYLSLKKNERLDPALVISRDVSQFVTSTSELLYSFVSNLSSTLAAISIFWAVLDSQALFYCLSILIIIKVISHFIGLALKNLGHDQKALEEKHVTDLIDANKQSESIALSHGGSFETQTLAKYLQEALSLSNTISTLSGLIGFTTELAAFGSFALGMWFCFDKIVSGTLTLEDVRTIGISLNYMIAFAILSEKNIPLIVRSEVSYRGMQMMDSINKLWSEALKNRDENFTITKTEGIFSFKGIVKDPYGNVLYSTMSKPLRLESGKKYQIEGRSGSGKSSIIRAFAGIWPYVEGKLEIPEDTCFLPQNVHVRSSSTTLLEIIRYPNTSSATSKDIKEIRDLMILFELDPKLIGLLNICSWQEEQSTTKTTETVEAPNFFNTLSGGEKQRIAIISAIIKNPTLLVLDEATSAIDEKTSNIIDDTLAKRLPNSIILFIKHNADSSRNTTPRGDRAQKKTDAPSKKIAIKEVIFNCLPSPLNTISESEED
jgi:putative ATP-binding cassette transporter